MHFKRKNLPVAVAQPGLRAQTLTWLLSFWLCAVFFSATWSREQTVLLKTPKCVIEEHFFPPFPHCSLDLCKAPWVLFPFVRVQCCAFDLCCAQLFSSCYQGASFNLKKPGGSYMRFHLWCLVFSLLSLVSVSVRKLNKSPNQADNHHQLLPTCTELKALDNCDRLFSKRLLVGIEFTAPRHWRTQFPPGLILVKLQQCTTYWENQFDWNPPVIWSSF